MINTSTLQQFICILYSLNVNNEKPPVKRTRRKSVSSKAAEGSDESPVKVKKSRVTKSVDSKGSEEQDGLAVKPVKRSSRKSASTKSVGDNQVKFVTQTQTSLNTSESLPLPVEPEIKKRGRPKKVTLENESLETEPVKRKRGRLENPMFEDEDFEIEPAKLLEEEADEINEEDFIKIPHTLRRYFTEAHKAGAAMGDRSRINIVNEALCDDIIDRLKPSLLKHVGCDIIDINPGIGLWSSKIHDLLKPRTHILMDPDSKKYLPYLQPLLDAENSTYQYIPKAGTVWEHLGQVTTPEFLPHQVKLSRDDPKINEPNDTLLVIANLGHFPKKKFRGFDSVSQLVMYQLLAAARSHALFHQYGLIRMLIWIPDEEKTTWLVRHIAQMRKNAVEAQITTKYIREVASSTVDNHRFVRDSEAALQNSINVVSNMDRMGISTPKYRQGEMEIKARKSIAAGGHEVKVNDFERFKRGWVAEWEKLQKKKLNGTLIKYENQGEDGSVNGGNQKKVYSHEFKRLSFLNAKIKTVNEHGILTDDLINDYDQINKFQGELAKGNPDSVDMQNSRDKLEAMIEEYDRKVEKLPSSAFRIYGIRLDGARITTEFEKREVEPLKVYAKEFIPSSEMCLLDIQPQALWPILRQNYPENYDVFEYIIGTMYAHPIDTVYESLEGLWPGAMEYIVSDCPSLTDPSKGGGFDLKHMTVRSLTTEMLKEIVHAWMKWPFRPTRYELMTKSGSIVHDPDNVEDDSMDGPGAKFVKMTPYLYH
ncbi:hypothetical protein EYC80_007261 [Monilinia laxa]|uniref:Mitochondrial transcription factor 1 n=1 Tax=Monilinia laxa TaxID=61186 RepID=A0A5N6JV74_MONLA|nr:hypothetical protein EYC80_007261 [Monilinia laxa]